MPVYAYDEGYNKHEVASSDALDTLEAVVDGTALFPVPEITVQSGDVVTIIGGFDNSHTNCWFEVYSTITIIT